MPTRAWSSAKAAKAQAHRQRGAPGARKLLEAKVFLELWVKVRSGWADDEAHLRSLRLRVRRVARPRAAQPACCGLSCCTSYDWSETSLIVELFTASAAAWWWWPRAPSARTRNLRPVLLPFQRILVQLGRAPADEHRRGAPAAQRRMGRRPADAGGRGAVRGFYLNELLLKLLARQDPHPALFDAYADTLWPCRAAPTRRAAAAACLRAAAAARGRRAARTGPQTLTLQPLEPARALRLHAEAGVVDRGDEGPARRALLGRSRRRSSTAPARCRQAVTACRRWPAARTALRGLLHYHLGTPVHAAHAPGDDRRVQQTLAARSTPMNPLVARRSPRTAPRRRTALSVNVNKVALLRNTRHLGIPSVVRAADAGAAGRRPRHHRAPAARRAPHPRARRARPRRAAEALAAGRIQHRGQPLPQPDGLRARRCGRTRPPSCPTARASSPPTTAGTWLPTAARLRPLIDECHALGVRVSLFMDPCPRRWPLVREVGADRVELYTEPYAAPGGTPRRRPSSWRALPPPPAPRRPWAWASTPATT
jgi:hypothetical protein